MDFVITERRRPAALVECKLTDQALSPSLTRLGALLGAVPMIQVVRTRGVDRRNGLTRVVSAETFLGGLC